MNNTDHSRFVNPRVDRIRALNDALRTSHRRTGSNIRTSQWRMRSTNLLPSIQRNRTQGI